jgi:plasmid replication initiation protein
MPNAKAPRPLPPEFVLQPHAISRSIYRLSATARKLIAMAMACLPDDLSARTARFTISEFCRALGISRSGDLYRRVWEAVQECVGDIILVEISPKKWRMFTWFSFAEYDEDHNEIVMEFSGGLAAFLSEMRKLYARMQLDDLGKLQSIYSLRLYELAMSYAPKSGKVKHSWTFELAITDLRKLFGVADGQYRLMSDFRKWVIDRPCAEINRALIGIAISPEYIRSGKSIIAVRFECEENTRKLPAVKSRKVAAPV